MRHARVANSLNVLLTAVTFFLVMDIFPARAQSHLLDNGVDPSNLGKGDWIWEMPECEASLGLADGDVQGVIDFETNAGMQWITVKCGDGTNIWTQFDSDLITRAHNAGLKIFGWAYVYGSSNVPSEINVALNALNLGADGFIIDAEEEYEAPGQATNAVNYCEGIRSVYPTRFLAHSPLAVISENPGFPYVQFGTYCDAVMPQDYWAYRLVPLDPASMVVTMNTEWRNWQNGLTGGATNAIKPIVPIGQGFSAVDGSQVAAFFQALQTNVPMATAGGYNGISFWNCQQHSETPDKWPAITAIHFSSPPAQPARFGAATIGADGTLQLAASGQVMGAYMIETSTNLIDWSPLTNIVATNGSFSFGTGSVTNGGQRFFRARSGR